MVNAYNCRCRCVVAVCVCFLTFAGWEFVYFPHRIVVLLTRLLTLFFSFLAFVVVVIIVLTELHLLVVGKLFCRDFSCCFLVKTRQSTTNPSKKQRTTLQKNKTNNLNKIEKISTLANNNKYWCWQKQQL